MRFFLILLALLGWLPLAALAQQSEPAQSQAAATDQVVFDAQAFARLAARADEVIDGDAASTEALEALRVQLTEFRTQATTARTQAAARVQPVQERLTALGPAPAEGESEAEDVAALRSELSERLRVLRAPVLAAEDAFQQADTLIKRIDAQIRDRNTKALLQLDPSPVNPSLWLSAGTAVVNYATAIVHEVWSTWNNPTRAAARIGNLPVVGLLTALALLLLLRARRWSRMAQEWLSEGMSTRWAAAFSLLGAVFQIVLPTIGLVLLVQAVLLFDVVDVRGYFLLRAIGFAGFALYFATWVTRLLFVPAGGFPALIEVDHQERREMRAAFVTLGLVFALRGLLAAMAEVTGLDEDLQQAERTLLFPLVIIGGLALYRIGRLLRHKAKAAGVRDGGNPFLARVGMLMGTFCLVAGIVGPIASAVGYSEAGSRLVFSTALSLLLIAGFYILFSLIGTLTGSVASGAVAAGSEDEQRRYGALFRVILGFIFICIAVPLLALVWGTRASELQEIWLWLRDGIAVGETRISLTDFVTFILIFSVGYMVTRLIQSALRTTVMPNTRLDVGGQNAIVTGTGYVGIFLAALAAIGATGLDLSNLAIVAGALSVGIGFGLQTIVSNFVSGIILLIERPIKEGDWIEVSGYSGFVRRISVRSTVVETFDRADVVIPNADLIAGSVTNWTHNSSAGRVIVPVGVAYGTDTRKVEQILREIAEAHPMVVLNPPPNIFFIGFGADSLNFEIRAILREVLWKLAVHSEMNHEIARRFAEEGIEIPFAQRDIYIKNLKDLRPGEPMPDSRDTDGDTA